MNSIKGSKIFIVIILMYMTVFCAFIGIGAKTFFEWMNMGQNISLTFSYILLSTYSMYLLIAIFFSEKKEVDEL